MKKRVLSLFMALALCLTTLPTAVFADVTENGEGSGGTHYVAESGGTQYETVQEILDNMEEGEITLLDSVTEDLTVYAATTIHMNGHSITGNIDATDSLTLNGGTVDGTVNVDGGTLNMTAPAEAEAAITGGLNVVSGSASVSGAKVGVKGTLYFDGTDNSLLNLVTEEQRPLRVCMNNGKEFLLFPQDLLAPICDSDFRLILLSAMRYAMGRNTCMPMVVADYIKRHIQLLDDKFLVLAADDISRHLEYYADHEPNPNLWQSLLDALKTEQGARATRQAKKSRFCPACGRSLEVMSITDNRHSPGGFDVIAHCQNCHSDYEWFCDKDGGVSDMKQYFFG